MKEILIVGKRMNGKKSIVVNADAIQKRVPMMPPEQRQDAQGK